MRVSITGILSVLGILTSNISAVRADDFYVTVYSAESVPYRPRETHTFVHAVRVGAIGESVGISWVPANLHVRGLTLRPERGMNYPIADTIAWVQSRGMRLSTWGPYLIRPELFELLRAQAARLDSGQILYKPTDNLFSPSVAVNCYHAIWAGVAPYQKWSGPFTAGDAAGAKTVHLFEPWIVATGLPQPVAAGPFVARSYFDRPTRRDAIRSFFRR